MTALPHPRIDAHLHLWDRARGEYAWITPDLGPLYADFGAEQAAAELAAAGMDSAILVQADDSAADTRNMLDIAAAHPWVIGVIGWVPLGEPSVAAAALEELTQRPVFRGIRQLVHIDPRADVLDDPRVVETLGHVAKAELAFDVPDAWPGHVDAVARLAAVLPDLTIVVDHLGKPPADSGAAWEAAIRQIAARSNTIAKVSGLQHLNADAVRRVWDVALEAFGPGRLAYGGDWPMTVPYGGYARSWLSLSSLIAELSPDEQAAVLSGTARRAYRLHRSTRL